MVGEGTYCNDCHRQINERNNWQNFHGYWILAVNIRWGSFLLIPAASWTLRSCEVVSMRNQKKRAVWRTYSEYPHLTIFIFRLFRQLVKGFFISMCDLRIHIFKQVGQLLFELYSASLRIKDGVFTSWAVPWARLCKTSAFFKFTCASCSCSSNSLIVIEQVQSIQRFPRQWLLHWCLNFESVLQRDSKMITRLRILSSIIFNFCRSTKLTVKSVRGDIFLVPLRTSASITGSDCLMN